MKYVFKMTSNGKEHSGIVELPDGLTDRQVDNIFIDWLIVQTSASWEVHQELPEKRFPPLKVLT